FDGSRESSGSPRSPECERGHFVTVTGSIIGGHLRMSWSYSRQLHEQETIERVAGYYREELEQLIAHCLSDEAGGYTPSDFPLSRLSQKEIDELTREDLEIEDIYPLTPMQEGILFHSLYEPGSGVYVEQLGYTVEGELDVEALGRAWQKVLDRH